MTKSTNKQPLAFPRRYLDPLGQLGPQDPVFDFQILDLPGQLPIGCSGQSHEK